MIRHSSLTWRLSIAVGAALLLLAGIIVVIVDRKMVELTELNQRQQLSILAGEAQRAIDAAAAQAVMGATLVAGQPAVQEALARRQRETLLAQFQPTWPALKKGGVSQFQFHLPPATSFLRLHMPEKHGDDLSAFRHTVVAANREKRTISGLENGVAGLGIRGVVPVVHAGSQVGTVELANGQGTLASLDSASHQSDQTTQIATAMNEMTATVREVANNSAQAAEALDHHQCRLGRWYDGDGRRQYGEMGTFQALEPAHRELHVLIKRIVAAMERHDNTTAEGLFREVEPLSQKVLAGLDALQHETT